jgi:tRNA (guanine6-N2)-methyltransferase
MSAAAEALPLTARSVDRVVANLPFGKQVGSHRDNQRLYPAVLAELDRVLTADGRAVLLTEDKRLLEASVQRRRGLKVVRQRLLKYNGATPTAYVLTRPR